MKLTKVDQLELTVYDINHWVSFYQMYFIETKMSGPELSIQATLDFLQAHGYTVTMEETNDEY